MSRDLVFLRHTPRLKDSVTAILSELGDGC